MIASLPMYDRPEWRPAWDAVWTAVGAALRARGVPAPERLSREAEGDATWLRPDLALSQACGLPLRLRLAGRVAVLGAFDFGVPGVPPGHYGSVVVTRPGEAPGPGQGARLAVNARDSQSGWALGRLAAERRGLAGVREVLTGSHAASAAAVAGGAADLAAIDAVTWRGIAAHEPALSGALEVAGFEPGGPGLPLIAHAGAEVAVWRAAIAEGLAAVAAEARALPGLRGFVPFALDDYRAAPAPRAAAGAP